MLSRIGRFTIRRRKLVLIAAAIVFALSGAFGGSVSKHLSAGGFDDPSSESFKADQVVDQVFGASTPNLILLVSAKHGTVDDPAVVAAANELTAVLAKEQHVGQAVSYWSLGNAPPLKSDDGTKALVLARLAGDQDQVNKRVEHLIPKYTRDGSVIAVGVGGYSAIFREVGTTIEDDLVRAESIALPITLILLLLSHSLDELFRSISTK